MATSSVSVDPVDHQEEVIRVRSATIYPERYQIDVSGVIVGLTRHEMRVLALLARRPGRVFTFREILDACHEDDHECSERSVKTAIHRLRVKLGDARSIIVSRYGVGYTLNREEALRGAATLMPVSFLLLHCV